MPAETLMRDTSQPGATCPAHAPKDHPAIPAQKVGILLANLGTPDGTDYTSMRRYLKEFLTDKRVIEWPKALWYPILFGIVLNTRPGKVGKAYESIWNKERDAVVKSVSRQPMASTRSASPKNFSAGSLITRSGWLAGGLRRRELLNLGTLQCLLHQVVHGQEGLQLLDGGQVGVGFGMLGHK